jgi:hypothetical protein
MCVRSVCEVCRQAKWGDVCQVSVRGVSDRVRRKSVEISCDAIAEKGCGTTQARKEEVRVGEPVINYSASAQGG